MTATHTDLQAEVAALEGLGVDALRRVWRGRFGEPPPVRSGDLLRRLLAEQLQSIAQERDPALERELGRLVRAYERGEAVSPPRPRFKPGTVLVRDHGGARHHVQVEADGFLWNGRRWKSLSQIAREITGVRWNGPRFFGLREEAGAS